MASVSRDRFIMVFQEGYLFRVVQRIRKAVHTLRVRRYRHVLLLFAAWLIPHAGLQAQIIWSASFPNIGTFSSPRVTDLTGDGVGDIILGAGREEFQSCDSAVIALNGVNGKLIWKVSAVDQIFGSAALKDLNGDGVEDAIIGGRSAELWAINGKTGAILWKFDKRKGAKKWYGFYNVQFIPDQDNDGLEDILTSNGGDVMVEPYNPKRAVGHLVVLSSRDGHLIAKAPMPDRKETYMSVSVMAAPEGNDYRVIFGTGGETIGGNLFVTTLGDVLKGDLSGATLLDSSPANGYIGPPVWIDINRDSVPDIVANAVEGKLVAFDGRTYQPLWSVKVPNTEAYSSIAPGYFTGDSIPDFFVSYAVGRWPKLEWSKQFMVNGANGRIEFLDSLGYYQTSTPVVVDVNGDGWDEALLSVNIEVYDALNRRALNNILVMIDFRSNEVSQLGDGYTGSNISSTPWIGDMDGDGLMDIIFCHETNPQKSYTFDGMEVHRMATGIPLTTPVHWGSYMGSFYDGIFRNHGQGGSSRSKR
jgi:outer membrane protein assembly factor BamB